MGGVPPPPACLSGMDPPPHLPRGFQADPGGGVPRVPQKVKCFLLTFCAKIFCIFDNFFPKTALSGIFGRFEGQIFLVLCAGPKNWLPRPSHCLSVWGGVPPTPLDGRGEGPTPPTCPFIEPCPRFFFQQPCCLPCAVGCLRRAGTRVPGGWLGLAKANFL